MTIIQQVAQWAKENDITDPEQIAAKAVEMATAWRPIEEAPDDDREILGYWHKSKCHGIVWKCEGGYLTQEEDDISTPTYWRELDEPIIPK